MFKINTMQAVFFKFYKYYKRNKIWWVDVHEIYGRMLFSFDQRTIFNFFKDYPHNLTLEQKEIFDKECPELACLHSD